MYERLTEPCTFIIDDWQAVSSVTEVRGLWNQILRDAPSTCRFVFLSRARPQLQFARFKTHGGYAGIQTDALRFTDREIDELFRDIYNPLDPTELVELERRTEGWAASLQLVEVSLRERKTPDERRLSSIRSPRRPIAISSLSCGGGFGPAETERSELPAVNVDPSADQRRARRAPRRRPRRRRDPPDLEQRGLFTNRLDAAEARYRYHGLFRDFLERRLISREIRWRGDWPSHPRCVRFRNASAVAAGNSPLSEARDCTPQAARLIARYGEDVVSEGRLGSGR